MTELEIVYIQYCEHCLVFKGNTKSTVCSMRTAFSLYLKDSGSETLEDFTKKSVEEWIIKGKREKQWRAKTIRIYLSYMTLFADWCAQRKLITKNRIKEIPRPKLPKPVPDRLTDLESELIMNCLNEIITQRDLCDAQKVGIFGYSHGGGAVYQLSESLGGFAFSGYIDAVMNSFRV